MGVAFFVQAAPARPKKFSNSGMPIASSEPSPPHSLNGEERFNRYIKDAFGPMAWVRSAAAAGIAQARDNPPEWGQGAKGYGRRFASKFGQRLVKQSFLHGLSAPLGQDPRYYRCECTGLWPRVRHAVVSSVTALDRNDKRVFSAPQIVAPFAAGQVAANTWYPSRYGPKDGLRMGAVSLGTSLGVNVFKEFIAGGRKHP